MLLPPNAYRADERAVLEHYRTVAAVGLPVLAYNNPVDTKVDLTPALLARLFGEGLIVGVKEFTGDPRRAYQIAELAPGLDVVIGSDDSVLEFALAGAKGWVSGYTNAFPRSCVELYRASDGRRPGQGPAAVPAAAPAAALGRQDRVRPGHQAVHGHGRPVRRPVPPAAPAAARRSRRPTCARRPRRRWPRAAPDALPPGVPRRRLPHRGDADPGHRRRRRHDPRRHHVRPAPVLHGQPGRHPQGADVRAARARRHVRRHPAAAQPARRRLGRGVHRGVRLPADVRARHHRRGHRPGRDGHGRGHRAGHPGPAGHPGRAGRGRGQRHGRRRRQRQHHQRARVHPRPGPDGDRARLRPGHLRHGLRRQLLRHHAAARRSASSSTGPTRRPS